MSNNANNTEIESIYADHEIRRFEELITKYERVAELCGNNQGNTRHDGVLFIVCFILTGTYLPADDLETTEQRRRHIADTLKLNKQDAKFLLEIYEREKLRRPDWFPDIQQLLSNARRVVESGADIASWPMPSTRKH